MTLSAAEEDALRSLLGRIKTDKFSGTPLRGGLPQMVQRTALPTAAKELAGQIIWIPGVSGVADHAWICLKDAADAYSWVPLDTAAGAGLGAIDFLTGTATGLLSAEIVVGTTPGGELGNTWASPTVDTTHSGSSHAGAAAAETAGLRTVNFLVGTATGELSAEIVAGTAPAGELGGTWAAPTVAATHSGSTHFVPGAQIVPCSTGALGTAYADFATLTLAAGGWALIGTGWGDNGGGLMTLAIRDNTPTVSSSSQWSAGNPPTGSSTVMNVVTGSSTWRLSALTVAGAGTFRGGFFLAIKVS